MAVYSCREMLRSAQHLSGACRPIVLSQPNQVLQIQTPQTITSNVVAMPTLSQDRPVPVAAPPVVSVALRTPSSDDDSVGFLSHKLF
ncbi:cyclic AMP-dependent transcription factor ATF-6 alpha [Lates japonicus]|uniref:Cyclic AMP-dependent transcription factor ATF-6 alpha n=1 Tax=Lates japonicus TaxID=270547 RepID=A0AAD3NHR8_LATJO|nr:cyclic AMP-dependent transcription factor ATF-6 alpha [Lates japonicus]GLD73228.1 cyclic AMP-dependent transcription factor ATF-6 alpha [Lates japonicus]